MRCPNCNSVLEEGAAFCQECGAKVEVRLQEEAVRFCPNCGEKLDADSIFCAGCGANVNGEDPQAAQAGYGRNTGYDAAGGAKKTGNGQSGSSMGKAPVIAAIIIGVILITACIAVGIKLINSEKGAEEPNNAEIVEKNDDGNKTGYLTPENKDGEGGETTTPQETITVTPIPTKEPTPTEEPLSISVAGAKPDVSAYFKVKVASASASSTIVQDGHDNSAIKAFDGDETSSWQEGVNGYGIGESITGIFDRSYDVKYIFLKLGNWRDKDNNIWNSRPQTITITCDGFTQQFTFPDEQREFYVELSKEVPMSYISIKIDAVYKGSKYDDTVIADVAIYGK